LPDPYDRWSGGPEIGPYDPTDDTRRDFLEPPEGRNEPPPAGSEHGERLGPDDVGLPRDEASGQTDPPPPEPPALMLDFERYLVPTTPTLAATSATTWVATTPTLASARPRAAAATRASTRPRAAASAPAAGTAPATAKPPERCL